MTDQAARPQPDKDNPSKPGHVQTAGRKENAAQPLSAAGDNAGADRYPSTRADDGLERPASSKGQPD